MVTSISSGVTRSSQWHLERCAVEWNLEAKAALTEVNIAPDNQELWLKLGCALEEQSLFRESIDAFSRGLAINPFNSTLLEHRGHRYLSIGEIPSFMADLTLCLRLDPKNWWAAYYLQEGYLAVGEYAMAEKVCRLCFELTPDDHIYYDAVIAWYYTALRRQGKKEAAQRLLELPAVKEILASPGPHKIYAVRLDLYAGLISAEEVEVQLEKTSDNGDYCSVGYGLADYYYWSGMEEKGDALIKKIVVRDEDCWQFTGYLLAVAETKRRGL